jgi:hypothetical protein
MGRGDTELPGCDAVGVKASVLHEIGLVLHVLASENSVGYCSGDDEYLGFFSHIKSFRARPGKSTVIAIECYLVHG